MILIGGRGCGKSALCRRLVAADARFTLRSLDDMIVEEAGMPIPDIVEKFGWRWFRDAEFSACESVARDARHLADGRVEGSHATFAWTLIDAGGGVVVDLDDDGNEIFSERKVNALRGFVHPKTTERENVVVYLRRDIGYLTRRTSGDRNRPSLSDTLRFSEVMERRQPWYLRAADYVVDATGGVVEADVKTKRQIADEVLEYFYAENGISEGDRRDR